MQIPDEVRELVDQAMQGPDDMREVSWVRCALATDQARQIRVNARLTTGEVAAAVGVTPATVWRWEQHARQPRDAVALRYGRFLRSLLEAA